jgi:hypothetical protein
MKEGLSSSETSILKKATRRNIPEDGIRHSHCRENLKSYMDLLPFSGEMSETSTHLGSLERTNFNLVIQLFSILDCEQSPVTERL